MFIEVSNQFVKGDLNSKTGRKELVNIGNIVRIVPLPPEDGYGRPQKGTELHVIEDCITVHETYEEVKALIARLDDIAMFRSKEDDDNGK